MQTLRFTMLVIGVIATLLWAACSDGSETIKIGGGFALTGDESSLDMPAASGAKLAAKEMNAAGGVNGKRIELIIHDSQYKMDVTAQVCKQFVAQDHVVAVIGFTDTDSVLACGPVVQQAGVPFITGKIIYPNGAHVPQKGVTVIAIKDGKFTLGAELVPEKVPAP